MELFIILTFIISNMFYPVFKGNISIIRWWTNSVYCIPYWFSHCTFVQNVVNIFVRLLAEGIISINTDSNISKALFGWQYLFNQVSSKELDPQRRFNRQTVFKSSSLGCWGICDLLVPVEALSKLHFLCCSEFSCSCVFHFYNWYWNSFKFGNNFNQLRELDNR